MIRAVERDDPGSTPASGGRFLSTESTCVLTLWRCSTRPHVIPLLACERTLSFCEGAGDGLRKAKRESSTCAPFKVACLSLTQVRHSLRSELAPQEWHRARYKSSYLIFYFNFNVICWDVCTCIIVCDPFFIPPESTVVLILTSRNVHAGSGLYHRLLQIGLLKWNLAFNFKQKGLYLVNKIK